MAISWYFMKRYYQDSHLEVAVDKVYCFYGTVIDVDGLENDFYDFDSYYFIVYNIY